jgi:lysozyme
MRLSANGLSFIKRWEGFIPMPYDDGYGNPTIGYGHKIRQGEHFTRISEAEASQLLAQDTGWAENAVTRLVSVPLTQSQFDALTSLVFNWGETNFAQSDLLTRLNAGNYAGAAERLGEHPVTSGGQYSAGLARRRQEEKATFLSGESPDSSASESGPGSLMPWLIGGGILVALLFLDD